MNYSERQKALDFINGKIKPVDGLGIPAYDEQYLLKRGEWTLVGGHPSSGKSTLELYTMFLHSIRFGTRWVCLMLENEIWTNMAQMVIWYLGRSKTNIKMFTQDVEKARALDWIEHHFKFLSIVKTWTALEALAEGEHYIAEEGYHGLFIDPYNALIMDKGRRTNSHEYDYEIAAEFRAFNKRTNSYLVTVAHPQTEAQRATHKDGDMFLDWQLNSRMIKPPNRTDFEGGSKWANRADNIKIWHRYINHPTNWFINILFVAKVKLSLTGGRPTRDDFDAILFHAEADLARFRVNGEDCLELAKRPIPKHDEPVSVEEAFDIEQPKTDIPF